MHTLTQQIWVLRKKMNNNTKFIIIFKNCKNLARGWVCTYNRQRQDVVWNVSVHVAFVTTVLIHLTWGWLQTTLKRKDPKNILVQVLVQIYQYGTWIKMAVLYKFPFPCRRTLQGQWLYVIYWKMYSVWQTLLYFTTCLCSSFFRDFNFSYSFKGAYRSTKGKKEETLA